MREQYRPSVESSLEEIAQYLRSIAEEMDRFNTLLAKVLAPGPDDSVPQSQREVLIPKKRRK